MSELTQVPARALKECVATVVPNPLVVAAGACTFQFNFTTNNGECTAACQQVKKCRFRVTPVLTAGTVPTCVSGIQLMPGPPPVVIPLMTAVQNELGKVDCGTGPVFLTFIVLEIPTGVTGTGTVAGVCTECQLVIGG